MLVSVLPSGLWAQGIKGTIRDNEGNPMPFASIYVKEIGTGTSSNLEGNYELSLEPGNYQVTFQFMGYKTQVKTVSIGDGFVTEDIVMQPRVIELQSVEVLSKAEDPSYTIMRKAIAKARYHLLQNDNYSAEVYMKGTGQITKIPWLFRRRLQKEGVDTTQVFTSESVSKIYFERPNTFKEKVISVRTSGQDAENANPNAYVNSSFYLPKVRNAISPLSPRAFSYYKFEYQGSFRERGYEINKIKVTPRSKGDDVFEGTIYIRENFWNIHSLDFTTSSYGFGIRIRQIFAPVANETWMPVTYQFDFQGSILGFAGKYAYLASVSNYQVTPNEDLDASVVLVDEKIDPAPEEIAVIKSGNLNEGVQQVFKEEKAVSRKQFRKLMRKYEQQERKKQKEQDILYDYHFNIDSLATRKDSVYWARIRPVPLTAKEIKGYKRDDSTYVVEKARAEADSSIRRNGQKFRLNSLVMGGYYKVGKRLRFNFPGLLLYTRFNTVEGWNFDITGTFQWRHDTVNSVRIRPYLRYGFAGRRLYSKLETQFSVGRPLQRSNFTISAGYYVEQFHPEVVGALGNTLTTLFLERNYTRLYEKDFVKVGWTKRFRHKVDLSAGFEYSNRSELFNNTDYTFFNVKDRVFSPNRPVSKEVGVGTFQNSGAFISTLSVRTRPWLKFGKYNGQLIPLDRTSPELRITYRKGLNKVFNSQVDFDHLEFGLKADIRLGVRARIDLDMEVGTFLGNPQLLFVDFKHFRGNRIPIIPISDTGSFRSLEYYHHSTKQEYVSLLTHIRFRKLLLTHFPVLRLGGLKENLFINYLHTATADNYIEAGYIIDNIFRFLRLDFVQSFQGWKPKEFAVRIGITSVF